MENQLGCDACGPLALHRRDSEWTTPIGLMEGVSISEIAQRALNKRCKICSMLSSAIEFADGNRRYGRAPKDNTWIIKRWEFESGRNFCAFMMSKPEPPASRVIFELFRKPIAWENRKDFDWGAIYDQGIFVEPAAQSASAACRAIPTRLSLPTNTIHEDCLESIKSWERFCKARHPECYMKRAERPPTRLVEIISLESSPVLRLNESRGQQREYVALSHCWGNPDTVVKTTTRNTNAHYDEIQYQSLSKSFQDAVYVTGKLGYRYLWIDSLCIIQDDSEDWKREAATMADIYENAALVLCAASSSDGTGGLFKQRGSGIEKSLQDPDGNEVIVRSEIDNDLCASLAQDSAWSFHSPMKGYPLVKRKWCFQERMLATRIVHFTSHELVWECKMEAFCECGRPNAQKPSSKRERMQSDKVDIAQLLSSDLTTSVDKGKHQSLEEWHKIVIRYTGSNLSFTTDILPAISGIAQRFAQKGLGKYLAGCWEFGLPVTLAWSTGLFVKEDTPKSRRPKEYCAPSWSWASTQGEVRIELSPQKSNFFDRVTFQLVGFHYTPAGPDPFGRVKEAVLEINTPAAELKVTGFPEEQWADQVYFEGWSDPQWFYADTFDDWRDLRGKSVWLSCICQCGIRENEIGMCLVLTLNDDDTYCRIGIVHIFPGAGSFARHVESAGRRTFRIR